MFLKPSFWWIIFITLFLPAPFLFSGDIYRWTDESGTVHFTDDLSKIPEKFLKEAERIEVSEEILKDVDRTKKPDEKPDRVKEYLEDLEKRIEVKRSIEKRISELEEELELSEGRLKKIEEYEKENFQYYLPFIGRTVPRKPRLIGGVKGHNMK